jgi:hypothetical protein
MKILRILFLFGALCACQEQAPCPDCTNCGKDLNVHHETLSEALARHEKVGTVDDEIEKIVERMEEKYGEQWDFCDCVVKGDSLNKAISSGKLSDAAFELLSKRFDEIELHCKVFKLQDLNRTPEERLIHQNKVKVCLENYGDK